MQIVVQYVQLKCTLSYFVMLCSRDIGEPAVGDIRLTGNAFSTSQGIVEYYQGSSVGWVTLCTDLWDAVDANIACIQLGYESGSVENLQTSFL